MLGLAGVGKTQIAIEFAHRFAANYEIVWWISSERTEPIAAQFMTLAVERGWVSGDKASKLVRRPVIGALHDRDRWLLIFDSAERPADIAPWLQGGGQAMYPSPPAVTAGTTLRCRGGSEYSDGLNQGLSCRAG